MNNLYEKKLPPVRMHFIDNLRTGLIMLVLAHHSIITYSGTGGWLYIEGRQDTITVVLSGIFCGVNQAFFMSFFFLISAYFTPASFNRKGAGAFMKDRLLRLGVPMLFFDLVINPAVEFDLAARFRGFGSSISEYFALYFRHFPGFGNGPLWFVEALLVFSVVYVLFRLAGAKRNESAVSAAKSEKPFPANNSILIFCLAFGAAAFAVRLFTPVGSALKYIHFQLPYFSLYIGMFVVGLAASRNNWFRSMPDKTGRLWFAVAVLAIVLQPVAMVLGGALSGKTQPFMGGFTWQSLTYSMWEPFVCVGICAGLTVLFRRRLNSQGALGKFLSDNSYTVYIIHTPVLVFIALALRPIMLHPLLKFLALYSLALPACYILASMIRKIPGTRRIL